MSHREEEERYNSKRKREMWAVGRKRRDITVRGRVRCGPQRRDKSTV